jgi:hypothetical protein
MARRAGKSRRDPPAHDHSISFFCVGRVENFPPVSCQAGSVQKYSVEVAIVLLYDGGDGVEEMLSSLFVPQAAAAEWRFL